MFLAKEIFKIVLSPKIQKILFPLKVLFIFTTFLFLGYLIYFLIKTRWLKYAILWDIGEFLTLKIYGGKKAGKFLKRVEKKKNRFSERDFKKAIILADRYFDKVLARLVPFFQAKTFEQRMERLGQITLPNKAELLKAHQIAKKIKEDFTFKLTKEEGLRILEIYKRAFSALDII